MNRNILVTGAAGFVGSFLCDELISNGYKVIGVDNFFRGKYENVAGIARGNNFIFEEMDLSRSESIVNLQKLILSNDIQVVFHLAAVNGTQYFYDQPLFVLNQNTMMTKNVMAAIADTQIKYLIYTSSSEVYGTPLKIPTAEGQPILLNSNSDRDSYAASKAIGEFYLRLTATNLQKKCLILRVFNMYGERMVGTRYGQVIPEFVQRMLFEEQFTILGDGSHTRSFCYIKDAVVAMRNLMESGVTGILNLGNDEEITILDLAKKIHVLANKPFHPVFLPARVDDHLRRRPDISALKSILPELSFTDLETGLKKVLDFFKSHGRPKP